MAVAVLKVSEVEEKAAVKKGAAAVLKVSEVEEQAAVKKGAAAVLFLFASKFRNYMMKLKIKNHTSPVVLSLVDWRGKKKQH